MVIYFRLSARDRTSSLESLNKTLSAIPPSKKKWTESTENLLCQLWKNNPLLYDPENTNYRNAEKKNEVMEMIADQTDSDGR
jgi:hypothetical protein